MQLSATSAAAASVGSRRSPFLSHTDHHRVYASVKTLSPLNWSYSTSTSGSLLICRSSLTPPNRPADANGSKADQAVVVNLNDVDNDIVKQARVTVIIALYGFLIQISTTSVPH
ncbi:hypothetical protein Tco_0866815 [Tanacetum coccineum]